MKIKSSKNNRISAGLMTLVLLLCLTLMPLDAFAETETAAEQTDSTAAVQMEETAEAETTGTDQTTETTETTGETTEPAEETVTADEPEEEVVLAETGITGYSTKINKTINQTVTISAVITPANGTRRVYLQRYSTAKEKWVTIYKKKTEDADSATVTFTINKKYRKRTSAKWRIYVKASDTAAAARSKTIKLTTCNIKTQSLVAAAACIYRIDGEGKGTLIYKKKAGQKRAQASTTKLMSAVVVMESGKIDDTTTITKNAAKTPWGSYKLKAGDVYSNRDLMYAMMLPSANDAAVAIAEGVGGSVKKFVKKMNAKAAELGLKNTHFKNPTGLDRDGHYTTALELAKLTAYAYTFPEISEMWNTKVKTISSLNTGSKWTLITTNAIFGYDKRFKGGKTGTTDNAGCCFAGVYTYKGETYVTVVLGSTFGLKRWSDTKKLHKYIRKYAATTY